MLASFPPQRKYVTEGFCKCEKISPSFLCSLFCFSHLHNIRTNIYSVMFSVCNLEIRSWNLWQIHHVILILGATIWFIINFHLKTISYLIKTHTDTVVWLWVQWPVCQNSDPWPLPTELHIKQNWYNWAVVGSDVLYTQSLLEHIVYIILAYKIKVDISKQTFFKVSSDLSGEINSVIK